MSSLAPAPAGQYIVGECSSDPVRSAFFRRTQTRLCYLPSRARCVPAPVTSLESRGQQQPQCPLVSSLHLAAVTGRHWTVPSLQKWSSEEFYSVIQILILTHVDCTMVIENSIRTRLSEIVNLNLFKSSENNNVRKSSQSKHNQKLVTNPSEETFVSNQSTAKLLKVININKLKKVAFIFLSPIILSIGCVCYGQESNFILSESKNVGMQYLDSTSLLPLFLFPSNIKMSYWSSGRDFCI